MRSLISNTLRSMGWDLRRSSIRTNFSKRLARLFEDENIDFLFDVGANVGQFSTAMFGAGYEGQVLSIEPIPGAHKLLKNKANLNSNWIIAPRCALGEADSELALNVTKSSSASSLLKPTRSTENAISQTEVMETIETPVKTLDEFWTEHSDDVRKLAIKIDTQGYELNVLKGGVQALANASVVVLELSIAPFYEGQPLYNEIDEYLRIHGFQIVDIETGYRDHGSGLLREFDAVYKKK